MHKNKNNKEHIRTKKKWHTAKLYPKCLTTFTRYDPKDHTPHLPLGWNVPTWTGILFRREDRPVFRPGYENLALLDSANRWPIFETWRSKSRALLLLWRFEWSESEVRLVEIKFKKKKRNKPWHHWQIVRLRYRWPPHRNFSSGIRSWCSNILFDCLSKVRTT